MTCESRGVMCMALIAQCLERRHLPDIGLFRCELLGLWNSLLPYGRDYVTGVV